MQPVFLFFTMLVSLLLLSTQAMAACGCCGQFFPNECASCPVSINTRTNQLVTNHESWMSNDFWGRPNDGRTDTVLAQLKGLSRQSTTVGLAVPGLHGKNVDGRMIQEAALKKQEATVESIQDFTVGEGVCTMASVNQGTTTARLTAKSYQETMMGALRERSSGAEHTSGAEGPQGDLKVKTERLARYMPASSNNNGTYWTGSGPDELQNCDTDISCFVSASSLPYDSGSNEIAGKSQALKDYLQNLFGPDVMMTMGREALGQEAQQFALMAKRGVLAKREVAAYCMTRALSQKVESSDAGAESMRNVLVQTGMPAERATAHVGENPSLATRMEVNAKKMTETNEFYTGLIANDADVLRKQAALQSTSLMIRQEMLESSLCSEMMLALIVESFTQQEQSAVQNRVNEMGAKKL